jgi:hypothetical protein
VFDLAGNVIEQATDRFALSGNPRCWNGAARIDLPWLAAGAGRAIRSGNFESDPKLMPGATCEGRADA